MRVYRLSGVASAGLIAALAWFGGASTTQATTLRRMGLPQLVAAADRVVRARAVERHTYRDHQRGRIFTDTTFEVLDDVKGNGPRRLTLKLIGGQVGNIVTRVAGTPVFSVGEEAILFTYPRPDGNRLLVGLGQGVLRIIKDPATGERLAVSDVLAGVRFLDTTAQGKPRLVQAGRRGLPLGPLMRSLRELAGPGGPPAPRLKKRTEKLRLEPVQRRRP